MFPFSRLIAFGPMPTFLLFFDYNKIITSRGWSVMCGWPKRLALVGDARQVLERPPRAHFRVPLRLEVGAYRLCRVTLPEKGKRHSPWPGALPQSQVTCTQSAPSLCGSLHADEPRSHSQRHAPPSTQAFWPHSTIAHLYSTCEYKL